VRAGQQFVFMPELHERGTKHVLGTKIKSDGVREGQAVLDLLARHPSTARFISTKLARRFVSDDPPPAGFGPASSERNSIRGATWP